MKYAVVLADGMADWPIEALGNKTPMEIAKKANMNRMASCGVTGLCKTVPDAYAPGSDVANLSILGYPPEKFYTGRSSLEAACMRVPMADDDVTLRANLVTLSDEPAFEDKTMIDYCGGGISTEDAHTIINDIRPKLETEVLKLYPGVSFRNILLWHGGKTDISYSAAHDIMGKKISECMPEGTNTDLVIDFMKKAHEFLSEHPLNKQRIAEGKLPVNGLWLWGPGVKPTLEPFKKRYGLKGGIVSGVDLIRGIGICADMDVLYFHSFTGDVVTDFLGKGQLAAAYLKGGADFVYVHIEAPDESGHHGSTEMKINAIEGIDSQTITALLDAFEEMGEDFRIMVLPDHPTPIELRTHCREPIPFVIYDSRHHKLGEEVNHCEKRYKGDEVKFETGETLFRAFLDPDFY